MDLTESDYLHTPTGTRQRDLTVRATYDREYLVRRYAAIDDRVRALAARRIEVLNALAGPPANRTLLDYGCGTGRVVEAAELAGWNAAGCDVATARATPVLAPHEAARVRWHAVTFFDSLEHLPDPAATVDTLAPVWVMVSVPWCHHPERWEWFGRWKHRRPGEHLWHWGRETLAAFFAALGYREVMSGCVEDDFRPHPEQPEPNILTAVFRRPG